MRRDELLYQGTSLLVPKNAGATDLPAFFRLIAQRAIKPAPNIPRYLRTVSPSEFPCLYPAKTLP